MRRAHPLRAVALQPGRGTSMLTAWLAEVPWPALIVIPAMVFAAYIVFGATGFGSSIINVPTVAHWYPLSFAVPLVTAVDCVATANATFRQWRAADFGELTRLLPTMLLGMAVGLTLLIKLPAGIALLSLGVFISAYGVYLLFGPRSVRSLSKRWALPCGFLGGIFSVLYGTGGPIYVIYLSGRVHDKTALRATMSTLVSIAVMIRTGVFVVTGLLLDLRVLALAALVLPFMLAGYWVGNRLHFALRREGLLKMIAVLLMVNGALLVHRAMGMLHSGTQALAP